MGRVAAFLLLFLVLPSLSVAEECQTVACVFGDEATQTIRSATQAQAFRIRDASYEESQKRMAIPERDRFHGYRIEERVESVPTELVKAFATELLNEPDYHPFYVSACFDPGVALRLRSSKGRLIDVLICLECNGVLVVVDGENGGIVQIMGAHNPLVRLARRLFPSDKALKDAEYPSLQGEALRALSVKGPVAYLVKPWQTEGKRTYGVGPRPSWRTLPADIRKDLRDAMADNVDQREGPCPAARSGNLLGVDLGTSDHPNRAEFDFRRNLFHLEEPDDGMAPWLCIAPVRGRVLDVLRRHASADPAIATLGGIPLR